MLKLIKLIVSIVLLAASNIIAVERNHNASKTFWALAGADVSVTIADIVTSERVIQDRHGSESIDAWLTGRRPGPVRMSIVEIGEAAVFQTAAFELQRHAHMRIARFIQFGRIGIESECVAHNINNYDHPTVLMPKIILNSGSRRIR